MINLDPLPLELVTRRAHVKAGDEQPSEWKRPIYGDRRQVVWLPPMIGRQKMDYSSHQVIASFTQCWVSFLKSTAR